MTITLGRAATLGIVGRSGSGKSTLARCLACLERPAAGQVWVSGIEVTALAGRALREARRRIQLVFQEPASAFNPRFSVEAAVTEPLTIRGRLSATESRGAAESLLARVGLPPTCLGRHPHELSGGQRQRLAIARALAADPLVLVLDEALAGLDLTTQAQLANVLRALPHEHEISVIYISHDLSLTAYLADEIAVMDDGQIVEQIASGDLFTNARHPRTRELLAAVPALPDAERRSAVA